MRNGNGRGSWYFKKIRYYTKHNIISVARVARNPISWKQPSRPIAIIFVRSWVPSWKLPICSLIFEKDFPEIFYLSGSYRGTPGKSVYVRIYSKKLDLEKLDLVCKLKPMSVLFIPFRFNRCNYDYRMLCNSRALIG